MRVARSRLIAAPASAIFAIVANPAEHPALDGSGTVRRLADASPRRLQLGSTFEMHMAQTGSRYRIINRVVEFDEPRRIAWEVHPGGSLRGIRDRYFGGHRWRYRLSETADGTLVEEEWDYTGAGSPALLRMLRFPSRNAAAIDKTLDRLADRFRLPD